MQGIARTHGTPKKQAAALRLKDLEHMRLYLDKNPSLIHSRDHALILLGFFGAFRRSELVNLTWQDIEFVTEGMIINVRHSKTDQEQEGMLCVIPFGNKKLCPVRSLMTWRSLSGVISGPVFRRISKSGRVLSQPLSAHYVNLRLRVVAKAAGLVYAAEVTAHSLRRGFATESSRLGSGMPAIKRHGRWRSTKTVVEYIEAGRKFADSAVKVMFAGGES